ncbi:MAG: hydroxymyristoyl-ACP dehydratase [Rhodanobacteraceae bacterium]
MSAEIREVREALRIGAQHPSLPGHFPGNPVVPGVVLLDRIASALENAGAGRFARIGAVKFIAPLRPDQDAELFARCEGARVRFRIEREGATVLSGEGELA